MSDSENKEEKVEQVDQKQEQVNSDNKKNKKEKKPKKVKIPFDKIDITTASEDDIIESGKSYNTKTDFICYFIMFIIFILMILPPVLRKVIPKPITEEDRIVVYIDMKCYRTKRISGKEINSTITATYRDGVVKDFEINHKYNKNTEATGEFYFEEVEELLNLDLPGLKKDIGDDEYTFKLDFYNNEALFSNETLEKYSYINGVEMNTLREIGFYCNNKTEEVEERVYIDTGKKVEDN